jgi:hypothetical protein
LGYYFHKNFIILFTKASVDYLQSELLEFLSSVWIPVQIISSLNSCVDYLQSEFQFRLSQVQTIRIFNILSEFQNKFSTISVN